MDDWFVQPKKLSASHGDGEAQRESMRHKERQNEPEYIFSILHHHPHLLIHCTADSWCCLHYEEMCLLTLNATKK